MKIEHIAIWVRDIDKVCEFYRKYFGGVVHPIYHNPTKQFTSRFITFDDGARLEVMHRPDIDSNVGTAEMFHVKQSIASVATGRLRTGMTEYETVGHKVSKQSQTEDTQHLGFTHLSFSVGSKEEVDHLTKQMSSEGVPVIGQPRTTGDGYYESVVLDPEGNRIEITV